MLRAVIHEHALYILNSRNGKQIPHVYRKAEQAFEQGAPDIEAIRARGGLAEYEGGDELGQEHEEPHREGEPEHYADAHNGVHYIHVELIREPFFEFGGLLLEALAQKLRGFGGGIHARLEAFNERHHPAHNGKAPEGALLRL